MEQNFCPYFWICVHPDAQCFLPFILKISSIFLEMTFYWLNCLFFMMFIYTLESQKNNDCVQTPYSISSRYLSTSNGDCVYITSICHYFVLLVLKSAVLACIVIKRHNSNSQIYLRHTIFSNSCIHVQLFFLQFSIFAVVKTDCLKKLIVLLIKASIIWFDIW